MQMPNSPLRFQPLFQYRIWGGDKLNHLLNKDTDGSSVGESWEVSGIPEAETVVCEGPLRGKKLSELIDTYQAEFLGDKVWEQFGRNFPLLIKFIDAKQPLSVQVHPDDQWARIHHNSLGKNEMWYILDAAPNAELILGFKHHLSPQEYENHVTQATLKEVLHSEHVQRGDVFYIPTGLVHAIGAGVVLAEIQQTSDITYRIYDYDRVDPKTGEKRFLHTEKAKAVADLGPAKEYAVSYKSNLNSSNTLIKTPYFHTNYLPLAGLMERDYRSLDSFVILIGVAGITQLLHETKTYTITTGQVLLLPAHIGELTLESQQSELIEVYIP